MMQNFVDYINERREKQGAKWWFKVGTVVLVAVALVILGFRIAAKNGMLVAMKARLGLAEHKHDMKAYRAIASNSNKKRTKALDKASVHLDKAKSLEKKAHSRKNSIEDDLDLIHSIRSWDDVDKMVK